MYLANLLLDRYIGSFKKKTTVIGIVIRRQGYDWSESGNVFLS